MNEKKFIHDRLTEAALTLVVEAVPEAKGYYSIEEMEAMGWRVVETYASSGGFKTVWRKTLSTGREIGLMAEHEGETPTMPWHEGGSVLSGGQAVRLRVFTAKARSQDLDIDFDVEVEPVPGLTFVQIIDPAVHIAGGVPHINDRELWGTKEEAKQTRMDLRRSFVASLQTLDELHPEDRAEAGAVQDVVTWTDGVAPYEGIQVQEAKNPTYEGLSDHLKDLLARIDSLGASPENLN